MCSEECLDSVQEACFLPALEPSSDPLPHAAGSERWAGSWQLGQGCCQSGQLAPCESPAAQVIEHVLVGCSPMLHLLAGRHCLLDALLGRLQGQRPCCWDQLAWEPSAHDIKLHGLIDADCSLRDQSGRTWGRAPSHSGPVIA